jgi:hypothetical protein
MRTRGTIAAALCLTLIAGSSLLFACGPKQEAPAPAPVELSKQVGTPATSTAAAPAAAATPTAVPVKVLDSGNVYGITKGAKAPTFTLTKPATIAEITDYHYIDGGGPTPGTIGLKGSDGTMYGPWSTTGLDGQGGVKNAFWDAKPNAQVPAGTYTVVDSDPGTWSTNSRAKGLGFSTVWVVYGQ